MDMLSTVFESYLNGLPYLLSHFVIAIIILIFGIFLHFKITPIDETALIKDGNLAAGISVLGAFVALALPLSASLKVSMSIPSIVIWGVTAILIQLICDRVVNKGEVATAIYVVGIKFSVALLNSAVISS
ncbi:DUF350 domain-containing protein [bacterium]|nr:DUF350 domain-containing protein [bacterium]